MNKPYKSVYTQSNNCDLQQTFSTSQSIESLDQAELDKVVGGAGGIFGTDIIDWTYFKSQMPSSRIRHKTF